MAHLRLLPAERSAHRPLSAQAPLRAHHELLPTWPLGDDVNDGKLWDDEEPMSSASLLDAVASGAAAAAKRVSDDAATARFNADEAATAAERADRFSEMAAAAAAEAAADAAEGRARELECVMSRHEQRDEDLARALTDQERDARLQDVMAKYGLDLWSLPFEDTIVVAAFDIIVRARKDVIGRLRRTGE